MASLSRGLDVGHVGLVAVESLLSRCAAGASMATPTVLCDLNVELTYDEFQNSETLRRTKIRPVPEAACVGTLRSC